MSGLRKLFACSVLAVALSAAGTLSAPVAWSNPDGSTAQFEWHNGQSDKGLFGSPIVSGTSFIFSPSGFSASSANGNAAITSDRLSFTLYAQPGLQISGVKIQEAGDYSILGTGSVSAAGALFVTNLTQFDYRSDSLHTTPIFPVGTTTSASGIWSGFTQTLLPNGWTKVQVVMNNILQTQAGPNSSAQIDKKVVGGDVIISIIIPEPATIGVMLVGGSLLLLRRKRRTISA